MPNHCSNDLRINGKIEDIKRFFETVKGDEDETIAATKIIPYPKRFADLDKAAAEWEKKNKGGSWKNRPKDGFNSGGYEWCIANWGTKWGMYDFSDIKFFKKSAAISFDTAWSPALPVIAKMGEMFPELVFTLRYYEMGAGFKGVYKVKGNEILIEETTQYRGMRGG